MKFIIMDLHRKCNKYSAALQEASRYVDISRQILIEYKVRTFYHIIYIILKGEF